MKNNLVKTIVYLTVNTQNNKIYIGVHLTDDPYKFDGYYGCGITGTSSHNFKHPKTPFQKACKKYGLDAFKRYTLYVCDTYEDALEKEREIVNAEFLKRTDVYNVALGGSGSIPALEIEVHQYDLNGKFIKTYKSYSEASRHLGVSVSVIHSAVALRGICNGSYWSETKLAVLNITGFKKPVQKPTYIYSKNGDFVRQFISISDCAHFLEVHTSNVQRAIRRGSKCKGFYVSLDKVDKLNITPHKRRHNVPVYQYDLSGGFIREFDNLEEVRISFRKPLERLAQHISEGSPYEGFY